MGFRWYKGRFLSDWEYNNVLRQESINFWFAIGLLIPTALLGFIGYGYGTGAMWAGIVIGLALGIFLNRLMIILGILGTISLIIVGVCNSKSNPRKQYFTSDEVNLRSNPNPSAAIITKIQPGEEVFFMADSSMNGNTTWYKITHGFEQGWVNKKLLIEK